MFLLGKIWLNQRFHVISTQNFNVITLNQRGKLIGFEKSNPHDMVTFFVAAWVLWVKQESEVYTWSET